jgi:hypothetical protein
VDGYDHGYKESHGGYYVTAKIKKGQKHVMKSIVQSMCKESQSLMLPPPVDDDHTRPIDAGIAQVLPIHFTLENVHLHDPLSSLDGDDPIAIDFDMNFILSKSDYQHFLRNPTAIEIKAPKKCPENVVERFKQHLRGEVLDGRGMHPDIHARRIAASS